MAYLKWIFFGTCLLTLIFVTWYKIWYKHEVFPSPSHTDPMYFYAHEPVYRQNFHFTLREQLKCEDHNIFLVIFVPTRPTDTEARQAIRLTWGSKKLWWGKQVVTLFLLGQDKERDDNSSLSIKEESILYGDIIQQDFLDTYYNLTLKTIMAFRWVTEFCSNARYVMKADTDTFINTGNLVKYLASVHALKNFITGYPLIKAQCFRDIHSTAYISYDEYPFDIFPPYLSGMGYVLDTRLALRVYVMMSHVKPIKFEDVYVGICLSILGVDISFPKDAELFLYERISFDICKFKHLIAVHRITLREMILFWDEIRRASSLSCY